MRKASALRTCMELGLSSRRSRLFFKGVYKQKTVMRIPMAIVILQHLSSWRHHVIYLFFLDEDNFSRHHCASLCEKKQSHRGATRTIAALTPWLDERVRQGISTLLLNYKQNNLILCGGGPERPVVRTLCLDQINDHTCRDYHQARKYHFQSGRNQDARP